MIQFVNRWTISFGCFALVFFSCEFVAAQTGTQNRSERLLQSAADIAALPVSRASSGVRVGYAPVQSSTSSGYQGSFSQQPQTAPDVYPYPAAGRPTSGVGSQAAFALSQGAGSGGRLTNQVSLGSGTSTGNLNSGFSTGNSSIAPNNGFSNNGSATRAAINNEPARLVANSRAPVEQQRSSTLNPVAQARINQAAVDRLRAQQIASNSNSAAASASRPPADRTASQANLFGQSGSQTTSGFRQSTIPSGGGSATRNTAAVARCAPVARCAQACNCCPQGTTPVSAGFQGAAFQAPAINPNVGAGLGLGVPAGVGGFNQQQCCQPQAGLAAANGFQGFQGAGLQQGFQGLQGAGFQGGQFGTGLGAGLGVPQFGAQGARWWTPFVRGSGVYTPLLDLTPNNAGTYLGQGIIGQPTAYVNGQLVRNLLRYLSP